MIYTEELIYKKAYAELYEVIKRLSKEQLSKIPPSFIKNVKNSRDNDYIWRYNNSKKVEEQDFMIETRALIVEMYERYLCPEDKKIFWNNYDRICLNMIEEKKKEQYNSDNIFKEKQYAQDRIENNNLPIKKQKENFLNKIVNFIRKILKNS